MNYGLIQAYVLLSLVSERLEKESNKVFSEIDLSASQFDIMRILWQRDDVTLTELSESCCCAPPNVTGLVDRLEKKGLIERHADANDRRVTRIHLSNEGRAIAGPARQTARKYLKVFEQALTPEELSQLIQLLAKVYRYLGGDAAEKLLKELMQSTPRAMPTLQ